MNELDKLGADALADPIRSPPPVRTVVAGAQRRHRRRRGAIAGLALVAAGASGYGAWAVASGTEVTRVETTSSLDSVATTTPEPAPSSTEEVPVATPQAEPLDTDGLIIKLEDAGIDVDEIAQPAAAASPLFAGTVRNLCVGSEPVWLYEYPSTEARETESDWITPDGQLRRSESAVSVSWIGPPRFYAAGRIIALTLSGDSPVADLLSALLGPTLSPEVSRARGSGDQPCSPTAPAKLLAPSGPSLAGAPDEVGGRVPLPYCGAELLTPTMSNPLPNIEVSEGPSACYEQRAAAGLPTEMIEIRTTIEGGPILRIVRLLPDSREEIFTDTTRDAFGGQAWSRLTCASHRPTRFTNDNFSDCGSFEILDP
ncbi:MAG: hypothetical protein GXP35_15870 [Actinobacteria bacterium]|nr:hypothetical protein [Actinomycetota bacterium]